MEVLKLYKGSGPSKSGCRPHEAIHCSGSIADGYVESPAVALWSRGLVFGKEDVGLTGCAGEVKLIGSSSVLGWTSESFV